MAVDSTSPVVKTFEIRPGLIDIDDGAGKFSVKFNVTDGASGIKYVAIWVTSPLGKHAAAANLWNYAGTDNSRTYTETFTVNQFLDPGKYSVKLSLTDNAGNTGYYDLADVLRVTNGADGFADGRSYYIGASYTIDARYNDLYLSGSGNFSAKGNAANNRLFGNAGDNKLLGLGGDDRLSGGQGNDTLIGGSGADRLVGGDGQDTASYQGASGAVYANLKDALLNTGDAKGDAYLSIENLTGTSFADQLTGDLAKNTLKGGAGNDTLSGGLGADRLYGGNGADVFAFKSHEESTLTDRDVIYDFSRIDRDKIDLLSIDASTTIGGNQAFKFVGERAFSKVAGELRYLKKGDDTFIHGDRNGDGVADFSIKLDTVIDLRATDFIL